MGSGNKPVYGLLSFSIAGDAEQLVMKAAESQMPIQLAKIPVEQQTAYGFSLKDNLEFCTIGKPYRILEFSQDFYLKDIKENVDYLVIKNEWRTPVLAGNEHRTLLSVNGISGNYIVAGLGDAAMARELQRKIDGIDKKETFYILRIFPLLAEFFVHEGNQSFVEAKFVPLNSAVGAIPGLSYDDNKEYSLTEVQYMIKSAIKKKSTLQKVNTNQKLKKAISYRFITPGIFLVDVSFNAKSRKQRVISLNNGSDSAPPKS